MPTPSLVMDGPRVRGHPSSTRFGPRRRCAMRPTPGSTGTAREPVPQTGRYVRAGSLDVWTQQVGHGADVLLIGGAGDTVESWQFQLDGLPDRYRLTAFDNRGAGRTAMPDDPATVENMADDAAAVLEALGVRSAHVAGFSGGSI